MFEITQTGEKSYLPLLEGHHVLVKHARKRQRLLDGLFDVRPAFRGDDRVAELVEDEKHLMCRLDELGLQRVDALEGLTGRMRDHECRDENTHIDARGLACQGVHVNPLCGKDTHTVEDQLHNLDHRSVAELGLRAYDLSGITIFSTLEDTTLALHW